MKDLPLSVLSRGSGQLVSVEGRQNGRLEVCLTPEDYYSWRSQDTLLRLSTSGCLLSKQESTLPKTYSTRRGALLLYSQGLVTLATCPAEVSDGRPHFGQLMSAQPMQQTKQHLSHFKEMPLSVLSYPTASLGRSTTSTLPPLILPQAPDAKYSRSLLSQHQLTSDQHIQIKALSVERSSALQESQHAARCKKRLDVFLQMPTVSTNSSPRPEQQSCDNLYALTPEAEQALMVQATETQSAGIKSVHDGQHKGQLPDEAWPRQPPNTNRGGQVGGSELKSYLDSRGVFLPPLKLGQKMNNESKIVHTNKVKSGAFNTTERHTEHLPPIEETEAVRFLCPKPQDVKAGKNTKQLVLPPLVPETSEEDNNQKQRKISRQHSKPEALSHKTNEAPAFEKTYNILLSLGEDCPTHIGLLTGGKSRQCSLAFLHNRQLLLESSDHKGEVVRGLLPLKLRVLENGEFVGSLILGPDGEIIQLSMFDNIRDSSQSQALEVVSAEGEKLPWIITLQPEHQHSEENEDSDGQLENIQQDHFINKHLDLQRSAQTGPGSVGINADTDAVENKKLNESQRETTMATTMKKSKHREGGKTVPKSALDVEQDSSNNSGVKDEDISNNSGHFSPSQQQKTLMHKKNEKNNTGSAEAQIQQNVDERKINITEETTTTKAKREKNTRLNFNRENEETTAVQHSPPTSGRRSERNGHTGAVATKVSKSKERKIKAVNKTSDKRQTQDGPVDNEEASSVETGKKKKRGNKPKSDKAHDPGETDAIYSTQEADEDSRKNSTDRFSPKQKHSNNVNKNSSQDDTDTDRFSAKELVLTTDKHSRSTRSLRSGASSGSGLSCLKSSSSEFGSKPGSTAPLSLSLSRLSSCSTVRIPEEELMLNPTKTETEQSMKNQEETAPAPEAQQAENRRLEEAERKRREEEAERKRREEEEEMKRREEEESRRQQQREQTEQRMMNELQAERQRRAEQQRLKKQTEEEERIRWDEEQQQRERLQQEQRERELRKRQERERQMEAFRRRREEEEAKRKAEVERLRLLEEMILQEEERKFQEMDENERIEYLCQKQEEKEARKREEEERQKRVQEAALISAEKARIEEELLAREMALLQQRLSFNRGLVVEAEGLETTQGISRPWTFSYFALLELLGL